MLRNRLPIVLIVFALGVGVYLFIDLHRAGRAEVANQFAAHQGLLARHAAHEVESYLADCGQVLQFLTTFPAVQERDRDRMAADFRAYLEPRKRLRNPTLSLYAEDGVLVYSTDATDPVSNCSGADFFAAAQTPENRGQVFVSTRFRMGTAAGKPLPDRRFVLATPLAPAVLAPPGPTAPRGQRGVLVLTVDLEALLTEHLARFGQPSQPERAWILDRDGTVLLQSEHSEMVGNNFHQATAECLQCHVSFDHAAQMLVRREGTLEYQLKERPRKLAAFVPVEYANAAWTLVVNVPYDEVTAFVRRASRQTLLLLALVAVAFTALSGLVYRNYRLKVRAEEQARQWQEKHQLEEQARLAEARYRTLFEQSPEGVLVIDPETLRPLEFNETAHRQLGYSREEFARLRVTDYEARETPEETQRHIEQVLREGRADFETQHRTRQGELRDVEVIVQTLALAGRPVLHCIFRDITERKRAQQALAESETRLRIVVESSLDAIVAIDERARLVLFNAAAEELFGYPASEVMGAPLGLLLREEAAALHQERVEKFLGRGVGQCGHIGRRMEQVFRRKDGTTFLAEVAMAGARGDARRLVVVSIHDIIERKRAEEEIRQRNRELSVLYSIRRGVTQALELEPLLNHAVEATLAALEIEAGGLLLLEPDKETLTLRLSRGLSDEFVQHVQCIKLGEGISGRAAAEKRPVVLDVADYPTERLAPLILREGFRTLATTPLLAAGQLVGALTLATRRVRAFPPNEVELLAAIGQLLGAAVQNGRLFKQLAEELAERRRTEAELKRSENQFHTYMNNSPALAWFKDAAGRMLYVNSPFERVFNKQLAELHGKKDHELWPEPVARQLREHDLQVLKTGQPLETCEDVPTPDGVMRHWLVFKFALADPGGETLVGGMAVDITERKQAEEQIRQQARLLDLAQDAIVVRDLQDRITFWNQGAERLYGWTAAEAVGCNAVELLYRDPACCAAARKETLEKGEWNGELPQRTKPGHEIMVNSRWTLVRDAQGQPKAILIINTDITEKKQLEAQSLRAQRLEAIGTLAGGIAHDLNNILVPILMGVPLLREVQTPEARARSLDLIEASAQRAPTWSGNSWPLAGAWGANGSPCNSSICCATWASWSARPFPRTSASPARQRRVFGRCWPIQRSCTKCCSIFTSTPATPCPKAGVWR
jgi:PAS domain S-box-containing protein